MTSRSDLWRIAGALTVAASVLAVAQTRNSPRKFGDYRNERPGVWHKITVADLPQPHPDKSVENGPHLIERPKDAFPVLKLGFDVTEYATGLAEPRLVRTAPNGDLFVAESKAGRIRVLRGVAPEGKALRMETFASGLNQPFGIAFYPRGDQPKYVYIANTDSVIRFPYEPDDLKARAKPETVVPDLPSGGHLRGGGHWTRDIAFSRDGKRMFVSVGSFSNADDTDNNAQEKDRAAILEFEASSGKERRVFASGIRNAVGIAVHPDTGELWASVNERDELGDDLVPDYVTRVREGGFYGWPWFYLGANQDPRHAGKHPELKSKVIVPDVLLQAHNASLQMAFYDRKQFPSEYSGHIFAAQHGSWNRSFRTGYEVVRIPVKDGRATGEYEDFMTGFVLPDGRVWGRPVGVAVAEDGALIVTDDGSNIVWRVTYKNPRP